jgi:hypothetical protein
MCEDLGDWSADSIRCNEEQKQNFELRFECQKDV